MAEENILLRVGIDQNQIAQSEKAIVSARTEIDRLKESNKQLEQQGQKNSVQFVKNQTDIKDLSNTVRENERVLQANAKMSRSTSGSIAQLRESVKTLQAEYVNLSADERENEKVGGELQKTIKAQNDALKDLEKQIGITGRNVGNYKDEINAALKESGLFNKAQAALAAGQQAVASAQKIATISTRSFGAALVATGIGAIIVLLGSLVSFLTQTQKGMDLVAKATSAVGTFLAVIIDAFSKLGEQLVNSIIPTFKGLGTIIEGILTLDFKQVKKGVEDVGNALSKIEGINILEVGAAAVSAAGDAVKLTTALQNLTRQEKDLDLQRAQSRQNIEKLKLIAEDQTKSIQERSKAIQEALGIELGLEQKAIDLQKEKITILAAQNDLSSSTDEDNNRLIDAQIQLANLQQESATKQIRLNNKLNALRKEGNDESIKGAKELEKKTTEVIIDQNKLFQESLMERAKATELEIRDTVNELKRQFAEGQITPEEFKNQLAEIEAVAIETRRAAFELQLEDTRNNAQIEADTKLAIEADLQQKLRDLDDETLDVRVKNAQAELVAQKKADEVELSNSQKLADAKIQAREAVSNAAISIFGAESAAGKIAATFQATIDTFAAATAALKLPFPFGQIVAAATIAKGLANVAKINSTPPPKFAEGGGIEVGGPSHSGGGVDVALGGQTVANVEGGEGLFVMKKDAFQSLKSLSNYNQMFGGNSWFGGGKKFLADGGAITRGSNPQIDRRSLQDAQNSIGDAMQQIKVITKVTDINRVSNEMKLVEMQGDLR